MELWLKPNGTDSLLVKNNLTRTELAAELEIGLEELNRILDGQTYAGKEQALLFVSAFGFFEICEVADWDRTDLRIC